jgi:hypothetical protein
MINQVESDENTLKNTIAFRSLTRCILQFQLISLLNRKPVLLYLYYSVLSIF